MIHEPRQMRQLGGQHLLVFGGTCQRVRCRDEFGWSDYGVTNHGLTLHTQAPWLFAPL